MEQNKCNCKSAEECNCQSDDWKNEDFSYLAIAEEAVNLEDALDMETKEILDFDDEKVPGVQELHF